MKIRQHYFDILMHTTQTLREIKIKSCHYVVRGCSEKKMRAKEKEKKKRKTAFSQLI